jgi:DNA-binding Lrp family transcriptional regulator
MDGYKLFSMPTAIMLINAELGSERDLLKELRTIEYVKEVYEVYGVYDIVVKIESDSMDKLKDTASRRIRSLQNVRSTLTMIVV